MRAFKGFDLAADGTISCLDHQYTVGETYVHDGPVELCEAGYHACPMPLDTLRYYPLATSAYHEVEVDDDAEGDGTKVVSGRITVGARLSIADMIAAHLALVQDRVRRGAATSGHWSTAAISGTESTAATSGHESTAATSGYWSTAATSGHESTAATSGYGSTAATSGTGSTAATSGYESIAATSGYGSIAVAGGYQCRARGALGCWLVLAERDTTGHILGVQAVPVDGETIRADTPYMLRGGQIVEAEA